ncbi:unnamed protein product, partial [Gulo gulo]
DSQNNQTWQSEAGHPHQLPSSEEIRNRVLCPVARTGVHHHYSGNNIEMGTACGKYYRVSTLVIINPGDSALIRSMPGQAGEK